MLGENATPAVGVTLHDQAVTVPEADPLKVTEDDWQMVVVDDGVILTVRGVTVDVDANLIESIAIDGSNPSPSSLFCHQKPISTLALLFAEAGNKIVLRVQYPVESPPGTGQWAFSVKDN